MFNQFRFVRVVCQSTPISCWVVCQSMSVSWGCLSISFRYFLLFSLNSYMWLFSSIKLCQLGKYAKQFMLVLHANQFLLVLWGCVSTNLCSLGWLGNRLLLVGVVRQSVSVTAVCSSMSVIVLVGAVRQPVSVSWACWSIKLYLLRLFVNQFLFSSVDCQSSSSSWGWLSLNVVY